MSKAIQLKYDVVGILHPAGVQNQNLNCDSFVTIGCLTVMRLKSLIIAVAALAMSISAQDNGIDDAEEILELDEGMEIEIVEDDDAIEKMPEITGFVDVPYPEELIDEGIAGSVLLEMIVSETGAVDSVAVVRPLHPLLDTLALNAARQFKFSPAEVGGEPVAVMLQYEYDFTPPKPEAAEEPATDDTADDDTADSTDVAADDSAGDTGDDDADVLDDSFELTVYGREEVKEVTRHRLTLAEVKRIPGMANDAVKVVQAMPGVARPRFGGTDVAVRGAPGWASRYYLDGVAVQALYHMGGLNSIYPSDALNGLDFYPGGFSVRYGGAVAGVIEMRSRPPKTDRVQGHADFSMLNGALFLEGPVNERVSFMASARRNFAGDLLKLYFKYSDPKNTSISVAPFFWDYLLRTDVVLNDNNNLFVSLLGSRDSLGMFIPSMSAGTEEIEGAMDEMGFMTIFHTLTVGLESDLGSGWSNSLRLAGTYAENRMSAFGMANMYEQPLIGYLRNQLSYAANDNLTLHFGTDIELINEKLIFEVNSGQNMIIRDTTDGWVLGIVGGYVNVEWRPVERLLLVPGVRYDWYPGTEGEETGVPAARLSGRYELTDAHTLKAAVGTYSQVRPMTIHKTFGDPTLPPTKAAHYVAGCEWQINDLLNLDAQGYFNSTWDIARSYDARFDYDESREIQRRFFSDGRGRSYGLELMLRHSRSDKFFGWVSYTLSRSEEWSKIEDRYILSSRDEPHHLQLLGSWKLPKNWDFGVRTRFVSGKPTSPIIGTIENENRKSIRPVYGEQNSERHDPFFQVDVRADKKFERRNWNRDWNLTYYVDLQNILWPIYKSPEFTYWNYNYTEKQKVAMIPMISTGVRAEF